MDCEFQSFRLAVGKAVARCEKCGADRFVRERRRRALSRTDFLLCTRCGEQTSYSQLLNQVSAAVIEEARLALQASRALRARKPRSS